MIPGLLRVGVPILKWMDKHGLLPKAIIDASPFHASMTITNLASIKANHIYHHCYDFGTTSVFFAMGNAREVPRRHHGEIVFERCMPIGVVMDERICSGNYFATAFRKFRKYLANPALLEEPPAEILSDPAL
jgi:pyruvate/2-oxoglutarate dehydrogenase complex dihydrolipoamide acyltransferase (E2) component